MDGQSRSLSKKTQTMTALKTIILTLLIGSVLFLPSTVKAQQKIKPWQAQWITGPGIEINQWNASSDQSLRDYGVYKFRKTIDLKEKPVSFVVHVSADNRYKLFINGEQVSQGPARGDLYFWNFETLDLAPYLNKGMNTVAAVVWNDGPYKPEAQISYLTAFILQGEGAEEEIINTNDTWKTIKDQGYKPLLVKVAGYYVAGPGELVDMNRYVKNWEKPSFDDTKWVRARVIKQGEPKELSVNSTGWMLVPSPLPQMEMSRQRLALTRKAEGVKIPEEFPSANAKVVIAPNSKATILLDQTFLTNAYPTLEFSGGKNASISMGYAEGLYIHQGEDLSGSRLPTLPKGNRNEVDGKIFIGKMDSLISDGSASQQYTPLWWRTYRYIQLKIMTGDEPLTLDDMYGTFTAYPFKQTASLRVNDPEMEKVLDIGWRTARLCAFETYMDTPYYEQLQYIGDTRIQALVSYYNTDDDRLARNAMTLMDHSRLPEGITQSRYPTDLDQQIPTFSLWWIGMLHDYYMYRQDPIYIKHKLNGARQVLSFFEKYQQADGSLQNVPYWLFTDWAQGNGWDFGMAPKGKNGESAVLDLQLMWTYLLAGAMENDLGLKELAEIYNSKAEQLKNTIQKKYWDASTNLYSDTETREYFSQHTNSLAILSGAVKGVQAENLAKKMLSDTTLVPASIYFKYYLHQALTKAGLGNDYMKWLDKWRENIDMGLTTWAEISDVNNSRSDSHAWGSSPNIEFYRIILGIDSDAPGFSRIRIAPHLGQIKEISGEIPHPNGKIKVKYRHTKSILEAEIFIPESTDGIFVWQEREYPLKAGKNSFTFK